MSQALANIARKSEKLHEVKQWAEGMRRVAREREADAVEDLEDTVAFILNGKHAKITHIAQELGMSRQKVRGMVERSRRRNQEKLWRGTN